MVLLRKMCRDCNEWYRPTGKHQKYCEPCQKIRFLKRNMPRKKKKDKMDERKEDYNKINQSRKLADWHMRKGNIEKFNYYDIRTSILVADYNKKWNASLERHPF